MLLYKEIYELGKAQLLLCTPAPSRRSFLNVVAFSSFGLCNANSCNAKLSANGRFWGSARGQIWQRAVCLTCWVRGLVPQGATYVVKQPAWHPLRRQNICEPGYTNVECSDTSCVTLENYWHTYVLCSHAKCRLICNCGKRGGAGGWFQLCKQKGNGYTERLPLPDLWVE